MSRDHHKLRVFTLADELAIDMYRSTKDFPTNERFGLQSQLRRSAISVAANIVEGCARRTPGEYRSFLNIATASSAETAYLTDVACRLLILPVPHAQRLGAGYNELTATLKSLVRTLEERGD
jgi:four helix bundle protein